MNAQTAPWENDFPSHNIELLSPELPAGSAWLVNCFLELGISVWEPWELDASNDWKQVNRHEYQYIAKHLPWQQTLPALQYGRTFRFEQTASCRASHRWAGSHSVDAKLILFVRDPRDMLYSQWRRNCFNNTDFDLSFKGFVESKYHHFPCSYVDYVAYYLLLWQAEMKRREVMVVRFEDYRLDAVHTLTQVLNFLNFNRSNQAIKYAIEQSDFKVVKKVEDEMALVGKLKRKFNYAAKPYEYASLNSHNWQALSHPLLNQVVDWLGYEELPTKSVIKYATKDQDWVNNMVECITEGSKGSKYKHRINALFKHLLTDATGLING